MTISLFCAQSSYPRTDSATSNRYQSLAEISENIGSEIVFINRHPILKSNETNQLNYKYKTINISGIFRENKWMKRQWLRISSIPRESISIIKIKKLDKKIFIHVYSAHSFDLIFYYCISKLVGAECIIHMVEHRSSIPNHTIIQRLDNILFEFLAPRLFNSFIAISNYIKDYILNNNSKANIIIIPPICEFKKIIGIPKITRERPYFLYCASSAYEEVAWFTIEAFLKSEIKDVDLILVLNGEISNRINTISQEKKSIKILSKLEYKELIGIFKGAHALLIPLRNTDQDIARYPHKISEYLASERPIISCKIGEIKKDFTHEINALLTDRYDVTEYSNMLRLSISNNIDIENIAHKGFLLGVNLFDTKSHEINMKSLYSKSL